MLRQARLKSLVGVFHIMFRKNSKQTIIEDDEDRQKFISMIHDLQRRYTQPFK